MNRLLNFPLLLLLFSFSSCIEFEREKLTYVHDEEKDELRVTLTYEGIFGNFAKGKNSQNGPDDVTTKDSLNQKQIEQLESVLEQERAFFFSNWIFEYDKRGLSEMLKQEPNKLSSEESPFGLPEKDLIEALIKNVEVRNLGFYLDEKSRLCGAQTLRLSNASQVIAKANAVLGRQLHARIPEMTKYSKRTLSLIERKLKRKFPFIRLEGNLVTVALILDQEDQRKFAKDTLKKMPDGVRIEYQKQALLLKCGGAKEEQSKLGMKCFEGYAPNAQKYLEENHKGLLLGSDQITEKMQKFIAGLN